MSWIGSTACIKTLAAMVVVAGLSSGPCAAATIVSVGEGLGTGPSVGAQSNQYLGVSWTQTGTWTDVVISAPIWTTSVAHTVGRAWLTQSIGPGALPGDDLANSGISFPANPAWTTLFSGLTLGPGTWYLILSVSPAASDIGYRAWRNGDGTPVTGDGVAYGSTHLTTSFLSNTAYPPGSTFNSNYPSLAFSVTGNGPYLPLDPGDDTRTVPEPASLVLLGAGLLGLGRRVRRTGR